MCLAASYLIRRLSTALLGVGHHRVAALYVFKLAYGQRAAQNYVSLQDPPLSVSPSASSLILFFSSVYSTPIRYFPLARAFIALVLVIRRKGKWAKDSRATLLRLLEKSKPLRASASNLSLSFPRPIRITCRWVWMFQSWGFAGKKTSCTKRL
jgi:hypothetical protein